MRNYIYHGTWTKMTICTPKGKRIEEHYDGWGYGGYQDSQEDLCLDDYNSDYTDYNSGRRLRHCHCGWSKVTTYQGLRTHQGKRGCTLKGVEVKEHDQHHYGRGNGGYQYNQKDQYLDDYNSDYIDYNPDRRLRDCHCGWSKVTTYRGLRTHQGKMGCTPKGRRIPESEQDYWKSQWEMRRRTNQPTVWIEEPDQNYSKWDDELPYDQNDWLDDHNFNKTDGFCTHNYNSDRRLRVCHCGWSKVTTYQVLRTHQGMTGCTPKGMRIPESEQDYWKSQWEMKQGYYQSAKSTAVRRSGFYMREI
ncbi:uncharacterized protein LOC115589573 isoform X2 [Sparus aurata]|uniref:uncharacterized protein LOC115589573 isoform X2 n=1 Tax=Sparus aurata TaxID=8175 RepID=UPI0011C1C817|nr:uncharacterized protein LOC115589573 isoform X2 [Sparus aurata]